ncbi:MAG: response regulator [Elusimicrobiota bacterium]
MTDANQRLSILIVASAGGNRSLLEERLRGTPGWDLHVRPFPEAGPAIEAMQERPCNVAFIDHRLPDTDGIKLLVQVRQTHPKTAVVMMSARGNEMVAVEAIRRGAVDYVVHDDIGRTDFDQLLRRAIEMQLLQHENLELRQLNSMKDQFISSVSHELRTPLAVILGYAKALEDGDLGPLTEPQVKALQAVQKRGERLLDMVNGLLTYKESTLGTQEVLLRPIDLSAFLEELLDGWPEDDRRGISIEHSIAKGRLWALADRDQLKEVFSNLLGNAVKFSPNGARVSVVLEARGKREAWMRVRDEGRGIPPEALSHIFDGFFHTDSDLTREIPGLGLGLALTRQIVELHGGRIWLESQGKDRGTTATVALPLSEPHTPHMIVEQQRRVDKKRVLIAENNIDIVEIVRLFLAGFSENLQLTTAAAGQEALELVSQRRFDLLVLDIMLPDMSGLDVLDRLQRLPKEKRPPVLVLSGDQESARQAVRKGAEDYLVKPFNKRAFLERVLKSLGLERRAKPRSASE